MIKQIFELWSPLNVNCSQSTESIAGKCCKSIECSMIRAWLERGLNPIKDGSAEIFCFIK